MWKCEIDKIKNDEGKVMYQIYYWNEEEQYWTLEPPFELTKEQKKNHFETTDSLEEAIKLILGYKCVLFDFVITGGNIDVEV